MTWLLLNIPLMILFFALFAGIPLWLVRKHPDTGPALAGTPLASDAGSPAPDSAHRKFR